MVPALATAAFRDISSCKIGEITQLFRYARPDAVISDGKSPLVSIEQTRMNPSGHNLPQRFSCFVRAAESGVCAIFYYPAVARRTFSDPGVRYLNIRVPLAQFRLMEIYDIPSISAFWPTNADKLPSALQKAQQNLADLVSEILHQYKTGGALTISALGKLPSHAAALTDMDERIRIYGTARRYRPNSSVRAKLPSGFLRTRRTAELAIDPPKCVTLVSTKDFVARLVSNYGVAHEEWATAKSILSARDESLVFTATANARRVDSEHPWPGYLTLLDVLYARNVRGRHMTDREYNLVYRLPHVTSANFLRQIQRDSTASRIVDMFADAIVLDDGVLLGTHPQRGANRLVRTTR
jgi:hypothetical protein